MGVGKGVRLIPVSLASRGRPIGHSLRPTETSFGQCSLTADSASTGVAIVHGQMTGCRSDALLGHSRLALGFSFHPHWCSRIGNKAGLGLSANGDRVLFGKSSLGHGLLGIGGAFFLVCSLIHGRPN